MNQTIKALGLTLGVALALPTLYGAMRLIFAVPGSETAFAIVQYLLATITCGGATLCLYQFMHEKSCRELAALVIMVGVVAFMLTQMYPAFAHDLLQPGLFFAFFSMMAASLTLAGVLGYGVLILRNAVQHDQN